MVEIKLNAEAFDSAMLKLTAYEDTLKKVSDNFKKVNDNMKKGWIGDGGTAFICAANVVERKFLQMIQDLQEEINDLETAKVSMFGMDSNLASSIAGAILGGTTGVSGIVEATKAGKILGASVIDAKNSK